MGAVPRHSWMRPAVGFAGVGGPSLILAEGLVGAVPRPYWLGPAAAVVGFLVPCHSWRRIL